MEGVRRVSNSVERWKVQDCEGVHVVKTGPERTEDSDNYIQLVRENAQKAENGEKLTNGV